MDLKTEAVTNHLLRLNILKPFIFYQLPLNLSSRDTS